MISKDITFCTASIDRRCVNRDCRRWATSSLVAAGDRQGIPLSFADMFSDCAIKKEPKP